MKRLFTGSACMIAVGHSINKLVSQFHCINDRINLNLHFIKVKEDRPIQMQNYMEICWRMIYGVQSQQLNKLQDKLLVLPVQMKEIFF